MLDIRYLILDGRAADEERLAMEIQSARGINVVSDEQVVEKVTKAESPEDVVLGLRWLAAIAPTSFEQHSFDLFKVGFEHPDPAVRHATLQVVSYPAWAVFRDVAAKMVDHDPDPDVRAAAEALLRFFAELENEPATSSSGTPSGRRERKNKGVKKRR